MASYAENVSIWWRHHDSHASLSLEYHGLQYGTPILDQLGVNQGGNASPTLFRTYLTDLGDYLEKHVGLCISETIMAHLLWADDWVLISDSESGLQKQLDGLSKFYSKNLMIVNELKTKVLVFGTQTKVHIDFNGKTIEQVESCKYLGNIVNTVHSYRGWSAFSYQLQIIWTRTTALISNDKWKKSKISKALTTSKKLLFCCRTRTINL